MRISATLIDSWLYYQRNEDASERELIESIKGVWKPSQKMLAGIAFDSILQDPPNYRKDDCYTFEPAEGMFVSYPCKPMDEECIPLFQEPGTWQCKDTIMLDTDRGPVTVVSKVDRLVANRIEEIKTRWSTFDYDKYADAVQWRLYLLTFGAAYIRYSVFGWDNEDAPKRLKWVERFTLYPYPEMEADCRRPLNDLVNYIVKKGLEQYVADDREKVRAA